MGIGCENLHAERDNQPAVRISMIFGFGTIWLFNIAMETDPFIDDFAIKTSIYSGFSMAMLNNQRVPENGCSYPPHGD